MNLVCTPFTEADSARWDSFVQNSRNGTIFHTRRFLSYHASGTFKDASLLCTDGDHIVGVLPAAEVQEDGKRILVSHPGASYGGLILSRDEGMKTTGAIVQMMIEKSVAAGFQEVRLLRLTPPSLRRIPSDDLEYWLYQVGARVFRAELATSLPLSGVTEEKILEVFSGKCRNAVRQGEKAGLTIGLDADFASFWPMLERTLTERHAARPTHTLEQITILREKCPEVRLFTARKDGAIVAGIVAITLHPDAVYTLYIAQDYAFQNLHPLHVLVTELAKTCIREKRKILHFGISTEDGGKVTNDGLFFFKESFGGVSIRRDSWSLPLV